MPGPARLATWTITQATALRMVGDHDRSGSTAAQIAAATSFSLMTGQQMSRR
jgi:hypothetical protein